MRLGNVDNSTGHATNHDHATWGFALHEMASNRSGKEIGAVNIDSPQLAHTVNWVLDGLEVLSKAGRGNEVVNLAVLLDDFSNAGFNGFGVRNIGEVSSDVGNPWGVVRIISRL